MDAREPKYRVIDAKPVGRDTGCLFKERECLVIYLEIQILPGASSEHQLAECPHVETVRGS